jgi:hypothetical protein
VNRISRFEPKNPDYRAIATATFEQQRAMKDARHWQRMTGPRP